MSEVKCFRLVTGEDIIADYEDNGIDSYVFNNPVQVSMVPSRSQTGEPNFGFMPFPIVSNDKQIKVKYDHIVFVCEPAEEFKNQYNSIFGSGIVTPTKKLII